MFNGRRNLKTGHRLLGYSLLTAFGFDQISETFFFIPFPNASRHDEGIELSRLREAIDIKGSVIVRSAMTVLCRSGRYIFSLAVFILALQAAAVAGQNKMKGVAVSYEQSGTSRVARFTNSNPYPVRVEFTYKGTKARGSGAASGEGAVLVAAEYSATYGAPGLSITSVQIKVVMRGD